MSIEIALHDAAGNAKSHGATTTITLKSGKSFTGRLKFAIRPGMETVLLDTDDGGWETIVISEIAAVGSHIVESCSRR